MTGKMRKILLCGGAALLLLGAACGCVAADVTPPVLTLYDQPDGYVDEELIVSVARATDERDGEVKVEYRIYSPSDAEIGASADRFTPHEEGKYRIVFTAKDAAGNVATETDEIVVRRRGGAPVLVVGDYEITTAEGEVYTLPEYSAHDAEGELPVRVSVTAPDGSDVSVGAGDAFFVDYAGEYRIRFAATNAEGLSSYRSIFISSEPSVRTREGVDGIFDEEMYDFAAATSVGGLRGLERIGVSVARASDGIFFAFDNSNDTRVSADERIELYLDGKGAALQPSETSYRIDLSPDGSFTFLRGTGRGQWEETELSALAYSVRPVAAVKLGEGTTTEAGNEDDRGYTAEIFVPYRLLGISADESFYFTMGCIREGDATGWDGWNEYPVFPDPAYPFKYVEARPNNTLFSDNRLYHDESKADGDITDAKYYESGAASTRVGGLRNLEGMDVRIARDETGLYFAFDVSEDTRVNDFDRVEIYFNVGEPGDVLNRNRNLAVYLQSNGALQILSAHNGVYSEFIPYGAYPAAAYSYGANTTPNDNTDTDGGYFLELYLPYELFNLYLNAEPVDETSRLGITFGLWRATEAFNTTTDWGTDPNKDWDGWSFGEFCDPLYPTTYAVLLADGRIATRDSIVDEIGPPTDPSVDGVLSEDYWQEGARLEIAPTEEKDGVTAIVYRDTEGLRIGLLGENKQLTSKDVVVLYVSTKDSSYTIGGNLDDSYEVRGQYASEYDYMIRIWADRSVSVYRGKYKDWGEQITDLSKISLEIDREAEEYSFVAELYIPYDFFTAPDGFMPTQEDTLGLSLRLGGENSRGSVVWNNLVYGGIECDSESPASYVRIDKDNVLYAATENAGDYRVDGVFGETLYSGARAELTAGKDRAELFRSDKGVHVRYFFGDATESVKLVLSTFDHGLGAPYVYDFCIVLERGGAVSASFGNSHAFYDPSMYASYCTPRAVFDGNTAELFIPYDFLSRYNATDTYLPAGYMQIDADSALRLASARQTDGMWSGSWNYNGAAAEFDILDSATYAELTLKEAADE